MLDDNPANNSITDNNRQSMPQNRRPSDACMEAGKPHRFQPGQSGNPGGRPKKAKEIADKALDASDLALSALIRALEIEMAKEEPNPKVIAMLADRIMDRGLGKPGQFIDMNQSTSYSEDFEAFIRRLNDKNDVAAQRLQNDDAADIIEVDFEPLERRHRE